MIIDYNIKKIEKYISQQRLMKALPKKIWSQIELHRFESGDYLCTTGEQLKYFYIIMSGRCRVSHLSEDGKIIVVGYLDPGELNGDIELLTESTALHDVCAICKVEAIAISHDAFYTVLMQNVAFLQMVCGRFAKKLYQTSQDNSSTKLYSIKTRVVRYLIEQSVNQRCNELMLDIKEASQCLGTTERHFRRILNELILDGVIKKTQGKIILLDNPSPAYP